MKKNLRKLMCMLLTAGMLLQDTQTLIAYAAEEVTETFRSPEQELMETPEPVTEQDVMQEEALETVDSSDRSGEEALETADSPNRSGEEASDQDLQEDTNGSLREPESYGPKQEEPEGTLVSYDENSCTYDLGNGTYRTIFGVSETFLDEAGEPQLTDNTLAADAGEDTPVYENTANDYQVEIPSEFQEGQGITISRDGYQVKLIPVSGDYSKSVQKENMIRYNEVFPHIDVQYTVLDDCVKEDIILYEPDTRVYQYELLAEGLIPSQPQEGGGILLSDEAGEPIFLLEAPMMEDEAGEVGTGLTMGLEVLEGKAIVTVTPDAQWLADASRSYPVRIDPAHTYLNGSDPELYCVAEGLLDTVLGGTTTPYVGYDDGSLTHRTANGETPYLNSRIYVDLAYDLTLPAENAEVSNAKLQFCQMTNYSHGEMKINLYAVEEDWDAASLTWNSQPGRGERLGAADACGVNGEWLTFDITAYITKLINGESASHGLLLDADNERRYCEAIYNRNSSYGPSLIVEWQEGEPKDPDQPENPDQPEDDPALKEYPLADLTLQLRPIMESAAGGRVALLGVFADGLAPAHAKVTWQLSGQQGISTTEAAGQYKFPDSTEFEALFPSGTKYKGQESNWQTGLFEGLTYDTVYTLLAAAEKDGTSSGQKTSDSFLIYRVQQNDTLPRIAAHYGVSLETMKRDNGIKSALVGKGSTLFIRNPKTSEPYSRGELNDSEKAEIDRALMGQGLHCEFGFEPVNLNTGNFYLESQDAVLNDLSGAFAITRVYNSKGAGDNSIFGKGWGFEYEESLALAEEGVISYRRGDGSSLLLTKGEDGCYYAPEGYEYTLRKISSIDEAGEPAVSRYELTDSSQVVRGFDGYGFLSDITDRQGHVTSLTYDENFCLSSITSPSGKVYGITCGEEGRITAILLPNGAVLSYTYDEAGNLISYTDACGGVITYEYDSQGRMVSWHDQNGIRVIQNGYDSQGRVTEQTDANGNTAYFRYGDHTTTTVDNLGYETVYRYDDQYRTLSVTYPDGTAETRSYDEQNHLASVTDRGGNRTDYTYDGSGNLLAEIRADGSGKSSTYNEQNLPVTMTDHNGNTSSYAYDEKGNLLFYTTPEGNTFQYGYDELSRRIRYTDANGNTEQYEYDGPVVVRTVCSDGTEKTFSYNEMNLLVAETDELGRTTQSVYDNKGNLLEHISPAGGSTRYAYDGTGKLLHQTDAMGGKITCSYDDNGNPIRFTLPDGKTSELFYDANGRKIKSVDFNGAVSTYEYDAAGNLISAADGEGNRTRYAYDALGNMISETDANGGTITYQYDTVKGLVVAETNQLGISRSYTYDGNGNLTEAVYGDGGRASLAYDRDGRVIRETTVLGLEKSYSYDANGNLLAESDSLGARYHYAYDDKNRRTAMTDAAGGTITYEYDAAGQLIVETDQNGNTTRYRYDSDGNRVAAEDAKGNEASFTYDANGRLTAETDRNGNTVKYSYNSTGDLTRMIDGLGYVTEMAYDGQGNLLSVTDALAQITGYAYDKAGRLVSVTDANGNTVSYRYDGNGNRISDIYPDEAHTAYSYDSGNRLVSQTAPNGLKTEYTYDGNGRVTAITDNEGGSACYTYDAAGNVTSETNGVQETTQYEYDLRGRLCRIIYPDGTSVFYEYDALDRAVLEINQEGVRTEFTYDALGNVEKILINGERTYTYDYDKLNRLVTETDPLSGKKSYVYDKEGHVIRSTDENGIASEYTYDAGYHLISQIDGNGGVQTYEYDALERLVASADAAGETERYVYDPVGNLLQYQDKAGNVTNYEYDVMGNLVKEISPLGAETAYTYDAGYALGSVTDAKGNITSYENDLKGNLLKQTGADGGAYAYAYDAEGRIVKVLTPLSYEAAFTYDAMGRLAETSDSMGRKEQYDYDAMGRLIKQTQADGSEWKYQYDAYGSLAAETDALGNQWQYRYDLAGRLVEEANPLGEITSYEYDPAGALKKQTAPGSREISYQYDRNYNLTQITDAKGYTSSFRYDALNRMEETEDAAGNIQSYGYDVLGQMISYTTRRGNTERYGYDAHGNILEYLDFNGKKQSYDYDLNNNLIKVTDARGGVTNYEYDGMNRLVNRMDALGRESTFTYDTLGNLTSATDAAGRTEGYEYDAAGRQTAYIRPDGSRILYDYDAVNNLVEKNYKDASGKTPEDAVLYGYNAAGERVSMSDAAGDSSYEYDALGRIVKAVGVTGKEVSYTYDEAGNLASILYPDGTSCTYTYDKNNNMTSVTDGEGNTTSYAYDSLNRLVQAQRANDTRTEIAYDADGNIAALVNIDSDTGQEISRYTYEYDAMGYVTKETEEEALMYYCPLHLYSHPKWKWHHYEKSSGRCSQGKKGCHKHCCREIRFTTVRTYEYDDSYQLLKVKETGEGASRLCRTTIYTYDAAGNRTGEKVREGGCTVQDQTYVYNDSNQLIRIVERSGFGWKSVSYEYDANGNRIREDRGKCGVTTYSYDMENRLKTIYEGKRLLMAAVYNGDGEKVFQLDYSPSVSGKEKRGLFLPEDATQAEEELYDLISTSCGKRQKLSQGYLLTEYINDAVSENEVVLMKYARNSTEQVQKKVGFLCQKKEQEISERYTYGMGRVSSKNSLGSIYYLYDGGGNVRKETNGNGLPTASYKYDAYGTLLGTSETGKRDTYFTASYFGYRGEETQRTTGDIYLRYRWYDTKAAAFYGEDNYYGSLASPLSQNRYLYTEGNPVNYADPSGHKKGGAVTGGLAAAIWSQVSGSSGGGSSTSSSSKGSSKGSGSTKGSNSTGSGSGGSKGTSSKGTGGSSSGSGAVTGTAAAAAAQAAKGASPAPTPPSSPAPSPAPAPAHGPKATPSAVTKTGWNAAQSIFQGGGTSGNTAGKSGINTDSIRDHTGKGHEKSDGFILGFLNGASCGLLGMSKDYRGFEEDVYNDVKDWEAFKRYEEIGNTVGTVVISILLAGLFLKILEGMGTPNVDVTAPGAEGIGGYIGSGGIGLSAELQLGLVTAGMTIGAAAGVAVQQASGNQGSSGLPNSGGGGAGSDIDKGGPEPNTLTDTQKSRLNALDNTINDHLTDEDFSGALRDLQGNPVPNGKGGFFDHLGEMRNSYRALQKIRKALEGSLKNPNLTDIDRKLLQEGLDKANSYILRIERLFEPYGGIK